MSPVRVVLTGATGFIGGAVLRELGRHRAASGTVLRAVGRGPRPEGPASAADEWVSAELTDPDSLRGACEGADVLLHLASTLGPDAARCEAVNAGGTAAVMADAVRAGVRRIVHLSTAAVYGRGPHRGIGVDEIVPAPVSAASRSRLLAERPAREAGAFVLRPGLVLGSGDRWVVPALAELVRRVPSRWDGGRGLLSAVAVDDLARLIAALALSPGSGPAAGGVFHASHPRPVRNRDLMDTLAAHAVLPAQRGEPDWPGCLERLRAVPGPVSERQFELLARDHWYRSEEIWDVAQCDPGPGPLAALADAADWYRKQPA
ncbi:NAD-dependent epimerase/dehydratase family protein (plasmid) [Streptomyces sp. NBC_00441]|uniref:NAD-dependent epimerase/dehydratase family protein n=1 Tax=Streptomyces sp. NBC_00441 TaxID=2975742 RepID=UPI002E282E92|nr:NAD-dependent epimerase/dehydratase family protein [Streptomyces sp. NBC_00441]